MYDIDRFFNEKISLSFDTIEEARIFSAECEARGIGNSEIPILYYETSSFVCNWNGGSKDLTMDRILYGTNEFHVSCGWKSMRASELLVENIMISEFDLMDFLERE